jgi:hypothetical protein
MSNGRSRPVLNNKKKNDDLIDRLWQQEVGNFIKFGERTGDNKVQDFINEAMKNTWGKTQAEKLEGAWLYLKNRRDRYNERVDELAAAEQYLFARSQVASHHAWFPVMNVLARGYQSYKWFFYSLGLENLLWRASDEKNIPLPPSDMQLKWSLQGAKDGMKDQQTKLQQIFDNEFKKVGIQSNTQSILPRRSSSADSGSFSGRDSVYREPIQAWVRTVTIPKVDINAPYYVSHQIRYGDRVWYLANNYGYQDRNQFTEDVRKLNPGIDFNRLKPGQIINVPSKIKNPKLSTPYALKAKSLQNTFSQPAPNSLRNLWLQGINKSRPSQFIPPPNASFVNPVKQAAQTLRNTPGPVRPIYDSTIDLLKDMERKAVENQRTQAWLQNISNDLNRGVKSKPFQSQSILHDTHISFLRDIWDKSINKSRPIDPFSGKPYRSVLEVSPHTPLDPKYHWIFPPEVITHSRPEINPLRQMSRGLR